MIDEKVLVERLEEKRSKYQDLANGSNFDGWHEEDIKYTAKFDMCEEIIEIVNQLAEESKGKDTNVPSNNGWIPCSERLPEFRQWVLATVNLHEKKYEIVMSSYENEEYWHDGTFIAWMPLPAPYQQKGGVKDED